MKKLSEVKQVVIGEKYIAKNGDVIIAVNEDEGKNFQNAHVCNDCYFGNDHDHAKICKHITICVKPFCYFIKSETEV